MSDLLRIALGVLAAHPFLALSALVPLVALLNHAIAVRLHSDAIDKSIREFAKNAGARRSPFFSTTALVTPPEGWWARLRAPADSYRPRLMYTLSGAALFFVTFALIARLGGDHEIRALLRCKSTDCPPNGLALAGCGALVYTTSLAMTRLNSSALSGKFLMASALRAGVAVLVGFFAASAGGETLFVGGQGRVALFLVGLFPAAALAFLRTKALGLFQRPTSGDEPLPLAVIDGLDEGTVDRLAELGIADVQHIATHDPLALSARSLYPINRVIDWMDQALLILYVRDRVSAFRSLGIRGAIDLAALYQDSSLRAGKPDEPAAAPVQQPMREHADATLAALSEKSGIPASALIAISRSLYEDAVVNWLWALWFDRGPSTPDRPEYPEEDHR